jgi:hypothetical protein
MKWPEMAWPHHIFFLNCAPHFLRFLKFFASFFPVRHYDYDFEPCVEVVYKYHIDIAL